MPEADKVIRIEVWVQKAIGTCRHKLRSSLRRIAMSSARSPEDARNTAVVLGAVERQTEDLHKAQTARATQSSENI